MEETTGIEKVEKVEKTFKEKVISFFSRTGKVLIILAAMVVGFYINEIYRTRKTVTKKVATEEKMPITKTHQETSVAINERGELIVLDRKTGSYEIYSDSVGLMIFNHYASKMYMKANQK